MPKAKEKDTGFEESMAALEKIVAQLESGDLPLEKALELFEEGVGLARRCQSQLEDAERKVEVLLRERGEIKAVPFDIAKENQADEIDQKAKLSSPNFGANFVANKGSGNVVTGESGDMKEDGDEEEDIDDSIPF